MRPFRSCFRGLMRMVRGQRFRILVSVLIGLVGVAASLGFVCSALCSSSCFAG